MDNHMASNKQVMIGELRVQLQLALDQGQRTATALDSLRADSDRALCEMCILLDRTREGDGGGHRGGQQRDRDVVLIDLKTMSPGHFGGSRSELYKPWNKKFKAFCNSKKEGFRTALGEAERDDKPITEDDICS